MININQKKYRGAGRGACDFSITVDGSGEGSRQRRYRKLGTTAPDTAWNPPPHTHTHHGVVVVWPPERQGTVAVCERCELPV